MKYLNLDFYNELIFLIYISKENKLSMNFLVSVMGIFTFVIGGSSNDELRLTNTPGAKLNSEVSTNHFFQIF